MEDETTERAAQAAYDKGFMRYAPPDAPRWVDISDEARESWRVIARAVLASVREPRQPIPVGLCGNREDHEPHFHESTGLGPFYCHADQDKRVPYAMERKDQ